MVPSLSPARPPAEDPFFVDLILPEAKLRSISPPKLSPIRPPNERSLTFDAARRGAQGYRSVLAEADETATVRIFGCRAHLDRAGRRRVGNRPDEIEANQTAGETTADFRGGSAVIGDAAHETNQPTHTTPSFRRADHPIDGVIDREAPLVIHLCDKRADLDITARPGGLHVCIGQNQIPHRADIRYIRDRPTRVSEAGALMVRFEIVLFRPSIVARTVVGMGLSYKRHPVWHRRNWRGRDSMRNRPQARSRYLRCFSSG